ncbi:hypothetical protein EX227_23280 [Providencia rettgeri]|uniref:Uncharacterized protein n=1 Tax=Providencia rettgeri TaxID=587 RepID=A0AAP2K228_PRORE|nr:hypothetical protein [Providencia rettgeri]MBX6952713.1 hypothetical protein [Providencia rettgeri]MBX6957742.1 hypothetical protein [Providencia rettgeri]MBX6962432.1 hypothetical protein [Providencia rettgeri]MBX6972834.1 hypothetical protein [Providencia rettgeri]MBX6983052.1 hypothetical protein [Providencia rettgeri]
MRISEYEYYDARANQEHLANQDDELTNEMAQRFYDALPSSVIRKMTTQESDEAWNAFFEAAKEERFHQ